MILPAFLPDLSWKPTPIAQLPSWDQAKRVGYDLETYDPDLRDLGPGVRTNGRVIGISFAIEDGPKHYIPFGHASGNLDRETAWRYIRDQMEVFKGDVVGANLGYDVDYSMENGVDFSGVTLRDVQIAEPLLDELQFSYSLDNIAKRRGFPGKDETLLRQYASRLGIDPKSQMYLMPSGAVGPYAEIDAELPLQLLRRQEAEIEEQGLWDVYDMECSLQPVLIKMRRRGVRVDLEKVEVIERMSLSRECAALAEIKRLTGFALTTDDTTKSAALIPVVRHLGFPIPKTDKGNDSLVNDYMASLKHPVCDLIMVAKKWNKLRNTFCKSIRRHQVNGRIHCTFNQMIGEDDSGEEGGARYGRLSCKQPNLQQQPKRDEEIGPLWRSIYLPEEGAEWISLDYSTQEPRWLTHYAELDRLEGAKGAADAYRKDPKTDFHQFVSDIIGIPRKPSKEIGLGKCYGMGGAKMAGKLGLPTVVKVNSWSGKSYLAAGPECQKLIDAFDKGVPFVSLLAKNLEMRAKKMGYIITAGGRRCRFPLLPSGKYDWVFKALNRLIQGSSGDQMKRAMVLLDAEGLPLQLQVHDEVDMSGDRAMAEAGTEIMLHAIPCNVPHRIVAELGPSWGQIAA